MWVQPADPTARDGRSPDGSFPQFARPPPPDQGADFSPPVEDQDGPHGGDTVSRASRPFPVRPAAKTSDGSPAFRR